MVIACIGIMAGIFLVELLIKNYIERMELPADGEKKLFGGKVLIRRHHNCGMAFNFAENMQKLIAVVSVVLVIIITAVFILDMRKRGNNLLRIGFSILLGGAFSNTYDRLCRRHVVDYLSFGVKWKWFQGLIFNLSDFCIMIGALLTILGSVR